MYLVSSRQSGELFVAKQQNFRNDTHRKLGRREAETLRRLNIPSVPYFQVLTSLSSITLTSPWSGLL